MTFFDSLGIAFGMFSRIPVPNGVYRNKKAMRYQLIAFPAVGIAIGLLWYLWFFLCNWLSFLAPFIGLGFVAIPVLVTGGFHLDGYADTVDAGSSYGPVEKKLDILKDPHVGSFAVIRLVLYFLGYYLLVTTLTLNWRDGILVGLSFALSRILSGLSVANFPMAKNTGLAHMFARTSDKRTVTTGLLIFGVVVLTGMFLCDYKGALAMLIAALLVYWHYYSMSRKKFGGITGDLSGWFLQKAEWWMMAALVLLQQVEAML